MLYFCMSPSLGLGCFLLLQVGKDDGGATIPLDGVFLCVSRSALTRRVHMHRRIRGGPKSLTLATADVNVNLSLNIRRPGFGINHRKQKTCCIGARGIGAGNTFLYVVAIGHAVKTNLGKPPAGFGRMSCRLFELLFL